MKLTLKGIQQYSLHYGLIKIIRWRTSWDDAKVKAFLEKNEFIYFNNLDQSAAINLLDDLEREGFEVQLDEVKEDIIASVRLNYESELENVRKDLLELQSRRKYLEQQKAAFPHKSFKDSPNYQLLCPVFFQ